jgi:hypothetical protein
MEQAAELRSDVRVLAPSAIEDFHAHLYRLDRESRFPGTDDHAIDTHCLGLLARGAILIGLYVEGVIRAAAEIVPDRSARCAQAAITVEHGFDARQLEQRLTAHIVDEASRYHLREVSVLAQSGTRRFKVPALRMSA